MTDTSQDRSVARRGPAADKGLTVERINATPGVHPYDEVTWERRDVVQTNWKTGETIFEQKGVEFPDFWSLNASTIVTTKYFRGAVGTPRREWSLKQLIDRVVLTYTKAGKEHGYFRNDEDAQVFEHELTWALLHQVFSFNSPVWFNVGTSAPQQVSACQPYDALVSTPAGLVAIGKLVEDDAVGTKVYDAHGLTAIVAVKHNGVKDVLRLHTETGHTLDVTPDHLVWRSAGEGRGRFVEAGALRPGDALEWHRRDSFGESEIDQREIAEAALAGWLQSGALGRYAGTADEGIAGLEEFVGRWGLRAHGVDMVVPPQLFTAPVPVVASYLRSVFQAEGRVLAGGTSTVVALDMVSERLVRGIQQLLQRFGIYSRVSFEPDARADRPDCWSVRIRGEGDRDLFETHIGFIDPIRAEKLARGFDTPGQVAKPTKRLQIGRIERLGAMEVYDIQTESGEYLSGNLRVHNCFILAVDDTMDSILNWYREEGLIFKGGSGAGLNLSRIRSSKELLSSGGTASGPVSFMRGADASAGTIKSGGATRRAAKMVVLDVDHPDIEQFIETKAREEKKIRALRDAGFDMDLGGRDISSVQYQNANNSVRVSDEFMRAVETGGSFGLRARVTSEVTQTVDAAGIFRKIAQAAWECADPGIQYDDTINDWHTNPETGRITASNPCFPADQRVVTDKGLIRIGDLVARAAGGQTFAVYTNDVTAEHNPEARVVATAPLRYMVTGTNEIFELDFSDGSGLRCTPRHRLWTANRGYVAAEDLTGDDQIVRSFHHAPRSSADYRLPPSAYDGGRTATGREARLPEKWTEELAHYLGWLVADGYVTADAAVTVYGGDDAMRVLARHQSFLAGAMGTGVMGFDVRSSSHVNGTVHLGATRAAWRAFLAALGVSTERSAGKTLPIAIWEAPADALNGFLRGLFDADGTVVNRARKSTPYVGLASRSRQMLREVQELLASLGIQSRLYESGVEQASFFSARRESSAATYEAEGPLFDLRISGRSIQQFASLIGFSLPHKAERLATVLREHVFHPADETVRLVSRKSAGFETTYNLTEPRNHSYIVNGVVVANCSEYMSLDNSSCNLASLNLLTFLRDDDTFDAVTFAKTVELVVTAMDISICFADFPTEAIGDTTRNYRQLGIGYANLGALLMATGHGYDSEGGRALAASITSLMTGTAYKRSAQIAGVVGPYEGYARNATAHKRVMRKHAAANDAMRTLHTMDRGVHALATRAWEDCLAVGERNGWRNAQASVLAPTGCLTGDTLVTTDRGLARLSELGDVWGERWQDISATVSTDDGPRRATRFFVNGEEPTRRIVTAAGYSLQGTLGHRVKVVDSTTGDWVWKRLADIAAGDVVPIQTGTMVGDPRHVPLPALDQTHDTRDDELVAPDVIDLDLAELVGFFMGRGRPFATGITFRVGDTDHDVVERLRLLAKGLFDLEPVVSQRRGFQEITLRSARLTRWWKAAGFGADRPGVDDSGQDWTPRVPAAIRETNDPEIYAAFLRGVFEAERPVVDDAPSVSTTSETFAADLRAMLLTLGVPTTTPRASEERGGRLRVRVSDATRARHVLDRVGFRSGGKNTPGYVLEQVVANEDGGVRPTYDLSVPSNLTYVAAGFISHNTIGFMMDCDTTGVEPDFSLVKFKKLVGGGSMQIVNQTIPRSLRKLGYAEETVEAVVEYISEHGHVVGAPGLKSEHYEVFDCAVGTRAIEPMGHVRMMAAVQPFLSGAISKTVNLPESASVKDIEDVYFQSWKLGLKALAIYRDNCKVGQPLSDGKAKKAGELATVEKVVEYRPTRKRLPKSRPSITTSFAVGGAEGYMSASSYPEDGLGEIFLKMSKQGSTLAGMMDAFSIAVSIGLQYGVPLETYVSKFTNMRFEPAGLTDDPDVRMAQSIMDYIFRRLALDYLPFEVRYAHGIYTAQERVRQLETGSYETTQREEDVEEELETFAQSAPTRMPKAQTAPAANSERPSPAAKPVSADVGSSAELIEALQGRTADAPMCFTCGTKMRPAGSCYVCEGCGSTSGCS